MKIMLFGGAFDPPHLGHHSISKNILDRGIADEVWYVPAKTHPFSKPLSDSKHRLSMLNLLIADDKRMSIETFELEKDGVSYSHETLDALSEKYPEHKFSWVIGSDNLAKFHLWSDSKDRDYREMLSKHTFYVYPRKGHNFSPLYENMIPLKDMEEVVVSSTLVKERLASREDISDLVDKKVIKYIEENKLYASS